MFADNRWLRMLHPGITAIVGAGGEDDGIGTAGHVRSRRQLSPDGQQYRAGRAYTGRYGGTV